MKEKYIPHPTGKYACGIKRLYLKDTSRKETLGEHPEAYRNIPIKIYYPILKESIKSHKKASGFTTGEIAAIKKFYHVDLSKKDNTQDYYEGIDIVEGRFPLIIFNHGYNGYRDQNNILLIELVSHGYIVISITHAHEAMSTDSEDGSYYFIDKSLTKINSKMYGGSFLSFVRYTIEILKLMRMKGTDIDLYNQFKKTNDNLPFMQERILEWEKDTLYTVNELKSFPIYSSIDTSKGIGVTGHSFGGAVAYSLCQHYPDIFTCGINIDGALFGNYEDLIMKRPFVQISCESNVNVETRPFIDSHAPVYGIVFRKMKHAGFTDLKFVAPAFLTGKLSPKDMHVNLVKAHIGFFTRYLKGDVNSKVGENNQAIIYREINT